MVELIFLHLPKTGGSSMLQSLIHVYGPNRVRHFERDDCLRLNEEGKKISEVLSDEVKVIHGHFYYEEVADIVERDGPRLLTFMRNPNDRLISNYYWWKHTIRENPAHPARDRANETLKVYASRPETQNRMARFLRGSSLDQFFFIGFLETFEEDLARLAALLNWPEAPRFHEKKLKKSPGGAKKAASWWLLRRIEKINSEDWQIYRQALSQTKA